MLKNLNILIQASLLMGSLAIVAPAQDRNYVVQLKGDADAGTVAAAHAMTVLRSLGGSGTGIHVMSAPAGQQDWQVLQGLATDPNVQAAETDGPVALPGINAAAPLHPASASPPALPIDGTMSQYYTGRAAAGYVTQPAASRINVAAAHQVALGSGATVAVLDTGVDFSQPVLMNSLVPGWDFVNSLSGGQEVADTNQETTPILDQETTPILDGGTAIILAQETTPILDQETTPILDGTKYPAYGHGTMVAGLVHLVAPKALLMPVRVFAADGTATISQIVAGIHWAVDNGVQVINMSFSTLTPSNALAAAIDYAEDKGVVCVASAGNDGQAEAVFPGAYSSVIDVASTDNQGVRSLFSNFGSQIALAAPGEGVVTTYPGNHYAMVWGTSFSAPLVAGGAALLVGLRDEVSLDGVSDALGQAVNIGQELGAGELDLLRAVNYLSKRGQD